MRSFTLQSCFHKRHSLSNCRQSLEIAGSLKSWYIPMSRAENFTFYFPFFLMPVFHSFCVLQKVSLSYLDSTVPKSLHVSVSTAMHHRGVLFAGEKQRLWGWFLCLRVSYFHTLTGSTLEYGNLSLIRLKNHRESFHIRRKFSSMKLWKCMSCMCVDMYAGPQQFFKCKWKKFGFESQNGRPEHSLEDNHTADYFTLPSAAACQYVTVQLSKKLQKWW